MGKMCWCGSNIYVVFQELLFYFSPSPFEADAAPKKVIGILCLEVLIG